MLFPGAYLACIAVSACVARTTQPSDRDGAAARGNRNLNQGASSRNLLRDLLSPEPAVAAACDAAFQTEVSVDALPMNQSKLNVTQINGVRTVLVQYYL